ncbi:MAG: nucleoside hydrolase [Ktedonobacteraceae bacterium]
MAKKLLLDTDIGSSIDDAVCLAYLLAQSECELLGITTVSGDTDQRAMLASVMCKAAGKEIPIFPGAAAPLLVIPKQSDVPQATSLQKWEHDTRFPGGHAVDFLRQTIRAHPGEVTLLTIGQLTNIALLFALDPDIPHLLAGLVMMCGMFTGCVSLPGYGPAEWNALLDPHAAAMVYKAPVRLHRSVGLDVTTRVNMPAAQVRERFTHPGFLPVLDMAETWFSETDLITFHDPLAATTIFDESICRFGKGLVEVELTSERLQGVTYWNWDSLAAEPKHEVALEVDSVRFFQRYFAVFR